MARKRPHPEHENHERWLVSYADFITLLFAFFVVMFATSQTDKAKAQQVADAVKGALEKGGITAVVREILGGTVDEKGKGNAQMKGPGGSQKSVKPESASPVEAELVPSLNYLTRALEDEIKNGKIELRMESRGLVVSLRQATFFPSGEDALAPATHPTFEKVSSIIVSLPNQVRLEGHTDSVPIHTARFRSNWELSASRAIACLELLAEEFDVPLERLSIAGYAETAPIASNDTEEGRAQNRRVDVVILHHRAIVGEPSKALGKTEEPKARTNSGASSKH
jgi:chemotaxis protein MotB